MNTDQSMQPSVSDFGYEGEIPFTVNDLAISSTEKRNEKMCYGFNRIFALMIQDMEKIVDAHSSGYTQCEIYIVFDNNDDRDYVFMALDWLADNDYGGFGWSFKVEEGETDINEKGQAMKMQIRLSW